VAPVDASTANRISPEDTAMARKEACMLAGSGGYVGKMPFHLSPGFTRPRRTGTQKGACRGSEAACRRALLRPTDRP